MVYFLAAVDLFEQSAVRAHYKRIAGGLIAAISESRRTGSERKL